MICVVIPQLITFGRVLKFRCADMLRTFLLYNSLIIQPYKENAQEVKPSGSKVQSMPITVPQCLVADTVFGNADLFGDSIYLPLPPITNLYSLEIRDMKETVPPNTNSMIIKMDEPKFSSLASLTLILKQHSLHISRAGRHIRSSAPTSCRAARCIV